MREGRRGLVSRLHDDLIDVHVKSGWVTLSGTVSWQYQSDAAYEDVANLFGVIGVTNEIRVVNP